VSFDDDDFPATRVARQCSSDNRAPKRSTPVELRFQRMSHGVTGARSRSREHWLVLLACVGAPLALVALAAALVPDPRGWGTHEQLGLRPCLPMVLWNMPCPGCGVTTAVTLALRGEPFASLRTQPLGLLVIAGAMWASGWALAGHARGRDLYAALPTLPWKRLGAWLGFLTLSAWLYKIALVRGWL
jgi:hypothetical protein